MSGSRHEHLARLLDNRRLELGLKWEEVATAANIKPPTLRAIRNGTNSPSPLTRRGLERALHWPAGTIDAVLEGAEAPSAMDAAEGILDENERLAAEIRALNHRDRQTVEALIAALKKPSETLDADGETHR